MNNSKSTILILTLICLSGCVKDYHGGVRKPYGKELKKLKIAIEPYKDFEFAQKQGYDIKATEYRTGMGYHYLNAAILDDTFEVERPEVLLYISNPAGNMELVAVEYGVPIEDLNNPPPPPEGFAGGDDIWKVDTEFSLWTLHAWVVMENPEGVFAPMNPMLP